MDEYLNNRQKEILTTLLTNPADTGSAYATNLQELVRSYPQSGLLRALQARALNEQTPAAAGAYFNSRALYKLYHTNENLLTVDKGQVIVQADYGRSADTVTAPATDAAAAASENQVVDETRVEEANETPANTEPAQPNASQPDEHAILTDQPPGFPDVLNVSWMQSQDGEVIPDEAPQQTEEEYTEYQEEEIAAEPAEYIEPQQANEPSVEQVADSDDDLGRAPWEMDEEDEDEPTQVIAPEAEYTTAEITADEALATVEDEDIPAERAPWELIQDEYIPAVDPAELPHPVWAATDEDTDIDDDIYDEITGIDDIDIVQNPAETSEGPVGDYEAIMAQEDAPAETEAAPTAADDEAEKLIMGNIAATDYFVFDRAFGDNKKPEAAVTPEPEPAPQFFAQQQEPDAGQTNTHQDISKYHDEKMPYTFMWWLDKTRKEHGTLYQPYAKAPVSSPVKKPGDEELQQQYYENIFHITSVDELSNNEDPSKTVEFDMQSKGDRIIQRFIIEDPHIHPPVGEKLDTENKAKKSSEDHNEMVTETLARIYADQMLYPKAIATYKKLMLKFPEKSRYFASRIENLEKKTN